MLGEYRFCLALHPEFPLDLGHQPTGVGEKDIPVGIRVAAEMIRVAVSEHNEIDLSRIDSRRCQVLEQPSRVRAQPARAGVDQHPAAPGVDQ